jgi:thiamine pyrophosphate-dependent acetolactate synthase large subunit-like protein
VLREALAQTGPAVLECVVDASEPPMPGHITVEMAKTVLPTWIREVI